MEEYVELINKRLQYMKDISKIIRDTPLSNATLKSHCEWRRSYVERLGSMRDLMNLCISDMNHQEQRINRHISELETGKK